MIQIGDYTHSGIKWEVFPPCGDLIRTKQKILSLINSRKSLENKPVNTSGFARGPLSCCG